VSHILKRTCYQNKHNKQQTTWRDRTRSAWATRDTTGGGPWHLWHSSNVKDHLAAHIILRVTFRTSWREFSRFINVIDDCIADAQNQPNQLVPW